MDWVDSHSVNCFLCSDFYDERNGLKFYPEGEICPECQNLKFIVICDTCGVAINRIDIINDTICPNCNNNI